ncbi:MAG TPA: hypothetical protein IAA44_02750 [Candidatus Blautia avistercoris]|nr:hypothetical protein [Candidatus Blautia avistercoris]
MTKAASVFDKMIQDVLDAPLGDQMLDECMSRNTGVMKKVPLRYRLIALAFLKGETLEQLNEKLLQEGCAQLYSRSLWEASLVFAFLHHVSYEEWRKLQDICKSMFDQSKEEDPYFSKQITLQELERYLSENSREDAHLLRTEHLTRVMEYQISQIGNTQEDFRQFLNANLHSFSPVREKTRYYFCKYLYFYLTDKVEGYLTARRSAADSGEALAELSVFKGLTQLKRKKMEDTQVRDFLSQTGISCREIFDNFNYFYFGYVSLDWLEVLLESYGDLKHLPHHQKKRLAESLRHYDSHLRGLSDEEVLSLKIQQMQKEEEKLDQIYSLDSTDRGYQRNRSGENTVRKYIKGALDLDRTTFICFLLFFARSSSLNEEFQITPQRLDDILLECGFSKLVNQNAFDQFIYQYLTCPDPEDLLMEEVTRYAEKEENFFFYNMYKDSKNYRQEYEKIMGVN